VIGGGRRARVAAVAAMAAMALAAAVVGRTRGCAAGGPAGHGSGDSGGTSLANALEVSGCAAVVAGPVCELPDDGALRVWVGGLAGAVTLASDIGPVRATTLREGDDGKTLRVVVPSAARELVVLSGEGSTRQSFALSPKTAPAWLDRARALRQSGDLEGAARLARAAEGARAPSERAFALGFRARLELAAGRQDASFPLFREAAKLHREAGRISDAADDAFALAFALNQRSHRYTEARAVLDEVRANLSGYADGAAREAYYRGTLATETGDARSALALLRGARERAARLGLSLLERNAINAYALQLELIGRIPEALAMLADLERLASGEAQPCEMVEISINRGFGALLANETREGGRPAFDAATPLERALALSSGSCSDAYLRTATLGNLALAALQKGDARTARARLAEARAGAGEARAVEVLFWHELEGRIALAEGDGTRALAAFDDEARFAVVTRSANGAFSASAGRGAALERLGRPEEALTAYRTAEEVLARSSVLVPLGEGRGTFVGDRTRSARFATDLLVRLGRVEEALAVVRTSRARIVSLLTRSSEVESFGVPERERWEAALGAYRTARAALDAEASEDWKLPRDEARRARAGREGREKELHAALDAALATLAGERAGEIAGSLAPLRDDEATLAFHPVRQGWVGIVVHQGGTTSFPIPLLPPLNDAAALAERLLSPVKARLAGARRLRILPYGPLWAVDFHALAYDGAPLVATVAVEYPLDLGQAANAPPAAPLAPPRALVVADPTLDLKSARDENDHVVRALRDGGFRVDVLTGPEATSAALLPRVAQADLFHYAGHGVFGGREGWESALPLAGGGRLTVGDVLAASAVPSRVVLSGCDAARSAADSPAASLGLAQAFVVAGADFAIAPTRPVDDRAAARMSNALYGRLANGGPVDAAEALREAQNRLRTEDPSLDWSAFRVVGR
jgi:cellulose synthase operon protein C